MNKRVLLIGHNFFPEPTGIGKYSGDMMEWLTKHGFDCTVVTTYPYYPYWKVQAPYKNRWYKKEVFTYPESDTTLTVHRCPSYVPANPTGAKRMIQDVSFWSSMFWVVLKLILFKKKHDYILTIAPPFHLGYLAWFYRKCRGGRLVYHVQDLQIEAAQELQILKSDKLFKMLFSAERYILHNANYISSISDGMIKKIAAKAEREVLFFPNWVDTSYFFPIEDNAPLKAKWGYKADQLICLYSGSMGEKQGLENIVFSAEMLQDKRNIKFIICGTGPYKGKLQAMVAERKLTNVDFLPLQDKAVFNDFLNMADIHLVIQKGNAGDLVMPSKLTTILSVGKVCIVTATPGTSLYEVVDKYDVGFIVPPDEFKQLADVIDKIPTMDISAKKNNARNYAIQYLSIDNIMNKFVNDISK